VNPPPGGLERRPQCNIFDGGNGRREFGCDKRQEPWPEDAVEVAFIAPAREGGGGMRRPGNELKMSDGMCTPDSLLCARKSETAVFPVPGAPVISVIGSMEELYLR